MARPFEYPGIERQLVAGWHRPRAFAAIDFETANASRASACAVALVRVERGRIARRHVTLVRPPTSRFDFTGIHGIRWADVKEKPAFSSAWRALADLLDGVEFIAAHNAKFDRGVLQACCDHSHLPMPTMPFVCTVRLARLRWRLYPTRLPDVCKFLGLALQHHDPLSDAEACARIVLAAVGASSTSRVRQVAQ